MLPHSILLAFLFGAKFVLVKGKDSNNNENSNATKNTSTEKEPNEEGKKPEDSNNFFLVFGIITVLLLLAFVRFSFLIIKSSSSGIGKIPSNYRKDSSVEDATNEEEANRERRRHRFSKIRRNSSKMRSPWLHSLSPSSDAEDFFPEIDADRLIQSDISSEKEFQLITEHDPYWSKERSAWEEYFVGLVVAAVLAGLLVFLFSLLGDGVDEE